MSKLIELQVSVRCSKDSSVSQIPIIRHPILSSDSQLQVGKGTGEDAYNGMLDCFRKIIRNEGRDIDPLLRTGLILVQDLVDYIVG